MLSELFLIDAEQLNGELRRYSQRDRGGSSAMAASAGDALADLLRTLELVAYSSCVRALARWLEHPRTPAQIAQRRAHIIELTDRLDQLIQSLRSDKPAGDDKLFATAWLSRYPWAATPDTAPAVLGHGLLPVVSPTALAAAPQPAAVAHSVHPSAQREGVNLAAAAQRLSTLAQARSLHESLAQTPAPSRNGIERVIVGLVAQARVSVDQIGAAALAVSLTAAPESLAWLAAAVAVLPLARPLRATAAAGVLSAELDGCEPSARALAMASQIVGQSGGRIDVLPGMLRLSLPRDPHRPSVIVLRSAQGWYALHALQYEGVEAGRVPDDTSPARVRPAARAAAPPSRARLRIGVESLQIDLTGPDASAEPPTLVWRYELPAAGQWPMPAHWQAMVSDSSGRLMPLLLPIHYEAALPDDPPALATPVAGKRRPRRRAGAETVAVVAAAEPIKRP